MEKRGQLSIFLLLILVLLIAAAFVLYFNPEEVTDVKKTTESSFDIAPIRVYFDACIDSIAQDSLILFGLQSGNMGAYDADGDAVFLVFPYYKNGENVAPLINVLENDYSSYLEKHLPSCTQNTDFPGYDIKLGKVNVDASFQENVVFLEIDYPLTISSKSSKTEIRRFDRTYPVRMGHIYSLANSIVDKFVKNPDEIEYSYLMQFEENEFTIIPYSENYFMMSIKDSKSELKSRKYNFVFGLVFE